VETSRQQGLTRGRNREHDPFSQPKLGSITADHAWPHDCEGPEVDLSYFPAQNS
jgi:hypothetical protein